MCRFVGVCLLGGSVLLGVSPSLARQLEDWPFDKLFKHADLVVIAKAISTAEAGKDIKDKPPEDFLKPILTTLEVVQVIKGEHRGDELVVFHYRLEVPKGGIGNGPLLIQFHRGRRRSGRLPPDYMLFLKKRQDGRYEAVSGQYDPRLSVKEVVEPTPAPDQN
jgi:hypothetical protein